MSKLIRITTYLFPPAGLILLWRADTIRLGRKLFGTLGILLYSILYTVAIVSVMIWKGGLQVEWRGGFPPVLTFQKTLPNYQAVEADRARKLASNQKAVSRKGTSPYWTGFRGPRRDGSYDQMLLSTHWPETGLPLQWRQPCG